jgi:hypothetical protein
MSRVQAIKAKHVGVGDWFGVLSDVDGRPALMFYRVLRAAEGPREEGRDGYFRDADVYIDLDQLNDTEVCRPNDRVLVMIPGA